MKFRYTDIQFALFITILFEVGIIMYYIQRRGDGAFAVFAAFGELGCFAMGATLTILWILSATNCTLGLGDG